MFKPSQSKNDDETGEKKGARTSRHTKGEQTSADCHIEREEWRDIAADSFQSIDCSMSARQMSLRADLIGC
ncbi:hypothetical protein GWI33_014033 [Rhynchophorus ferrugineus]|uniref:Uncharacterized protein n=1 Tax=Rhynchophorus ferrugineus TaxID=354439 RepID=A0A834IFV5_RHYFE|nr:hypothetical protein GWI33_014033 [Rhynchophorus ferrugineus]